MSIIIALDVGDVRVGVATSDSSQTVATPHAIFQRPKNEALNQIISLIKDHKSKTLLVGLPYNQDGTSNEQCEKIIAFTRRIERRVEVKVEYFDESYTTIKAKEHLTSKGQKDIKTKLDALAAAFMLQEYLDRKTLRTRS